MQQFGAIDGLSEEDWSWVLNVNVMGTVRTVREFLPLLRAGTGWRRIVITASSGVLVPGVRLGVYQTSKFAVMGFGETLRQELAGEGITARGIWAMFDYVEFPVAEGGDRFGLKGYGHYAEDYVREDGEWRIGRLELSRLRVDPLGEDPLVPSEGGPP